MGDTWEWDSKTWSQVATEGPPARAEHEGVVRPGLGLIVFGGIGGQGMSMEDRTKLDDLWAWNGSSWLELRD